MKRAGLGLLTALLLAPARAALPWVPPVPDARGYGPLVEAAVAGASEDERFWALLQLSLCAEGGFPPAEDLLMSPVEWVAQRQGDRAAEARLHCASVTPAQQALRLPLARHLLRHAPGRHGAALEMQRLYRRDRVAGLTRIELIDALWRDGEAGDGLALESLAAPDYALPAAQREALRVAALHLKPLQRIEWMGAPTSLPPLTAAQLPKRLLARLEALARTTPDPLPPWPRATLRRDWQAPEIGPGGFGPAVARIVREGGAQNALWAARQIEACRYTSGPVAVAQYALPRDQRGVGPFAPERVRADCASLTPAQFALTPALARRAAQLAVPGAAQTWAAAEPQPVPALRRLQGQLLLRAAMRGDLDALFWLAAAGDKLGLDPVERMAFAEAHQVVHARELPDERSMLFHSGTGVPPALTAAEQIRSRAMAQRILAGLRPH